MKIAEIKYIMLNNSSFHQNDVLCTRIDVSYHPTLSKPVRFLSEQHKGSCSPESNLAENGRKSNCLVFVWSIRVMVKTITMMSNLVNFYLIVFIV